MTKKKIFTIAGIAVGAVIVIGIVIWLIFFRGGSVAPSDPNEMVYVTSVADITGTARYLKKHLPQVYTVGLEPATSPLITQGKSGAHGLQGIGANFIPKNYDASVVDEVLTVTDEEAYKMAKLLARTEGILVGITSGAALAAAVRLLRMPENAEKTLVALLPDSGDRYFSTPIFE